MIQAVKFARAFNREKIVGFFDDTNDRLIPLVIRANPARVLFSQIATDRAIADVFLDIQQRFRQITDIALRRFQQKKRQALRRFLANAEYDPEEPVDRMRCLLEQGLLCMGPVTAGGCGGKDAPLCIRARVPCRGCYGPVRQGGNQLLDMRKALASNGIDHRGIVDRTSLLRFSGAHGLLRPRRQRT